MARSRTLLLVVLVGLVVALSVTAPATAQDPDITGLWYGVAQNVEDPWISTVFSVTIFKGEDPALYGSLYIPALGLFNDVVPTYFDGQTVQFVVIPGELEIVGELSGGSFSGLGFLPSPYPPYYALATWQASPYTGGVELPGEAPGPMCAELPPLYCTGTAAECTEIVPFDPDIGAGYLDYPLNFETWDNQYRSYVRRDVRQLVKYATAKVECKTADWDYGNFAPVGLGDMSEADGSIPGTSVGYPGHPPGTHEDGNDIDIAYYQLYASDNLLRPVGVHHIGYEDMSHLVEPPYALDPWRTALLIAYLSEHPHVRVIGVDGQIGLVLEDTLDALVVLGWLDPEARAAIPLAYEVTDVGYGWFKHHHHHLHVSMNRLFPLVSDFRLTPETLNRKSRGKFVTGRFELVDGYGIDARDIDSSSVALVVNGHTLLYADWSIVTDYNENGIPDLTVKFDRQKILQASGTGVVEMAITGSVYGYFFQESATIRIR